MNDWNGLKGGETVTSAGIIATPQLFATSKAPPRPSHVRGQESSLFSEMLQNVEPGSESGPSEEASFFGNEDASAKADMSTFLKFIGSLTEQDLQELLKTIQQLLGDGQHGHDGQDPNFSTEANLLVFFTFLTVVANRDPETDGIDEAWLADLIQHIGQPNSPDAVTLLANAGKFMNTDIVSSFHAFLTNSGMRTEGQYPPIVEAFVRQLRSFLSNLTGDAKKWSQFHGKNHQPWFADGKLSTVINELIQRLTAAQGHGSAKQQDQTQTRTPFQQPVIFQPGPMHRIQQFEWHTQLKMNAGNESIVGQIERMMSSSRLQLFRNGTVELHVRLVPDHLGSLTIKLISQNGELVARIIAETASTKSLIESQLHQLRHAFSSQQIPVDKIDVVQAQQPNLNQYHQESNDKERNHDERNHSRHQNDQEDEHEDDSFQSWLHALTV